MQLLFASACMLMAHEAAATVGHSFNHARPWNLSPSATHMSLFCCLQSQLLIGGNKLEDIPAFRTLLARVCPGLS